MATRAVIADYEHEARTRTRAAIAALGRGLPAKEERQDRQPEPSLRTVGDLEMVAVLSEAVVELRGEVDQLAAALAGASGGRQGPEGSTA